MENKKTKIVVSGDICVNSLQWITYPQNNMRLNWQTHLNMHSTIRNGEALLLSKLVALSTGESVLSPNLEDIELIIPREFLNSTLELEILEFTQHEIEVLGKSEHTHWYNYRKKINLKCNEVKYSKGNPNMVCWEKLCKEKKNEEYEMVKAWLEILAKSNFKLDRLKFLCNCETEL
jgi:hypothetical protein